jgi:hypothetical protein
VAETSATGRAMSVSITDTGISAFTSANTAWRRAQAGAAKMLGPAAASTLDQWLGLNPEMPGRSEDATRPPATALGRFAYAPAAATAPTRPSRARPLRHAGAGTRLLPCGFPGDRSLN